MVIGQIEKVLVLHTILWFNFSISTYYGYTF